MYQAILFDLDGTLTDSGDGITRSVQYALEKIGHPEPDLDKLRVFVGPPLLEQFMDYAGVDADTARIAVVYYRERYAPIGIFENSLYPGIKNMLHELKSQGYVLGIASSKPEAFVLQILEHFGIRTYFDVVSGAEMNGGRTTKSEVVEEALRRMGYENRRDEIVLVGDREHDVLGARECSVECLAVSYGYGSMEELEAAKPLAIVSDADEVVRFFRKTPLRKENPLLTWWRCFYPILIHFALAQVVSTVALLAFRSYSSNYESRYMSSLLALTGIVGLLFLIPGLWLYRRDQRSRELGRMIPRPAGEKLILEDALTYLLMGGAFSLLGNLVLSVLEMFIDPAKYGGQINQAMEGQGFLSMLLWVGIAAPIAEEVLFRWLVYLRLRDRYSIRIAAVISAAVFAIYHGNLLQGIYTVVLGFLFAYLMEMSGCLWAPILMHIGANSLSVVLSQTLEFWDTTVGGMTMLALLMVLLFAMLAGFRKTVRKGRARGYRAI